MIQRLVGERNVIALIVSVIISFCLLFFFLPKIDQPEAHWLISNSIHYPITSFLLSIALILGVALLYRELQVRKKLTSKRSYYQLSLLSLLLVPLTSGIPFVTVAAIGCFTLGAMALLSIHRVERASEAIQRVGMAIGVSVLLCPPLIWGAIIIALMSIRLRHRSWRNGAIFLLGIFFPFVLLTTFMLAMNWHEGLLDAFITAISEVSSSADLNVFKWVPAIVIVVFTLVKPMGDTTPASLMPIREMELLQTQLIWFGSFVILGLIGIIPFQIAIVSAAIPASALITISLENFSKWWVGDLAVIILLSSILLKQSGFG